MTKKSISPKKTLSDFFNCTLEIYGRFWVVSIYLFIYLLQGVYIASGCSLMQEECLKNPSLKNLIQRAFIKENLPVQKSCVREMQRVLMCLVNVKF